MTTYFTKFKKPYFWPIFPIFEAKHLFSKNSDLSRTSYGFLTPWQHLEKFNDPIPRKRPERRTEGQKEWRSNKTKMKNFFPQNETSYQLNKMMEM